TVDSNVINGAYRGISSSNLAGNKALNNNIYVTGKDFSTNSSTGGDYGIALSSDAVIKNNTITGMFVGAAISAGDNSLVEDNFINASKGYAITANGNDVVIRDNEIYTVSSAGVYQEGLYSGIVVDNNTLVSESGIGVLLKKASKSKYPSNITITYNKVTTSNKYIIDATDADKNSWIIENNTGGKWLTPEGEVDPSVPDFVFNGTTHYITPDNYHSFIDSDGNLMSDVVHDSDILNFKGTFSNKEILLSKSVKITGNATFLNSTFIVSSDGVWIENMTIINKHQGYNAWGIFVADTNTVKIVNNNISVYDPTAAYAVYVYQSSKVYVEDNHLFSNGESLTYTLLGYGAENCQFKNNVISCLGTGEIHSFAGANDINGNTSEVCIGHCLGDVLKQHCLDGTNIVPEIYRTYGILMIKSSNNTVMMNNVYVTSLVNQSLAENSTNSLVGIDFYFDCDNNIVLGNTVLVEGKDNYLYGAGALAQSTGGFASSTAKNNTFALNDITVNGDNVVEGLIFGQGCTDNLITLNNVQLNTGRVAYGITLEASDSSNIVGNIVNMSTGIGYGIEAYDSSGNSIVSNVISGEGSIISGIAGTNSNSNVIQRNLITSNGDNSTLPFRMHDVIKAPNSGIFFEGNSTGNQITDNNITVLKGYPVELSKDAISNNITDNYLKGIASGDAGVKNPENNVVKDNYYEVFGEFQFDSVTAPYMGGVIIIIKSDSEADGAVVSFKIGNDTIGNATFANGEAKLSYKLDDKYNVGNYNISATASKEGFKTTTTTSSLEVVKANVSVKVDDVITKPGVSVLFNATLTDLSGSPIVSREVKFYRNTKYIGKATSDENGLATAKITIPASLEGEFTLYAEVAESGNYMAGKGSASLSVSNKDVSKIVVENLVMNCRDGTRFYATLKDENGNVLANKSINFTINGASYPRTTNDNGKTSIAINLDPGNYSVTVSFGGDAKYKASSASANVTVKSTLVASDVNMMFQNGTRFYVSVIQDGKPVANEKIRLNINGVFYDRTTKDDGSASIAINLHQDTYIVTTERLSTGEKLSNTLVVNSLLSENKNIELYYKNGTGYTVKVTKQDGSVAGAGEIVTFNINGVFYERKTNENGTARLNLNLNPGEYVITADYKGCKVSNKIKVLPVLYASDLTKKFTEDKAFPVLLVDGHGKPLSGTNVTFNINGVFYTRTTNATGYANLNIRLQPGEYIITSSYNGDNIANKVTITAG
nr:Ig-like domain repeat protein [Methanobrevibacter sp.]